MENKIKVVLISGMFAGGWVWNRMVTDLSEENYEFIIIDEPLGEMGRSVNELATYIYEQYIGEKDEQVVLVGNSLGGLLSVKLALLYPENVSGVVLSGSPGMGSANLGIGLPRNNKAWLEQLVRKIFVNEDVITDEELDLIIKFFERRENVRNVIQLTRETNHYHVFDDLRNIHCPTYLLWGEEDQITPLEPWKKAVDELGKLQLQTFERCGHSPMIEKSKEFSYHLHHFIDQLVVVKDHA